MISSGSTGLWKREMTAGGVFLHSCVVTNIIGTTMSTNIAVSVNGAFKLNFKSVMENKRILFAEASDGEFKSWLTIPHKETRKNPQNMQERIYVHSL